MYIWANWFYKYVNLTIIEFLILIVGRYAAYLPTSGLHIEYKSGTQASSDTWTYSHSMKKISALWKELNEVSKDTSQSDQVASITIYINCGDPLYFLQSWQKDNYKYRMQCSMQSTQVFLHPEFCLVLALAAHMINSWGQKYVCRLLKMLLLHLLKRHIQNLARYKHIVSYPTDFSDPCRCSDQ